jgi:hypothetical protein
MVSSGTTTTSTNDKPFIAVKSGAHEEQGPVGCYLVYEPVAGGRLMLHYSQGYVPDNAVGFWCPGDGKSIQGFKFKQAGGRSELIKGIAGGDANRRKYFIGWCQFLKQCKAMNGKVIQFTNIEQGVLVDVYAYNQATNHPYLLDLSNQLTDISNFDAIAVMPVNHAFMKGVKSIVVSNFLELGNLAGASTTMS